MMEPQVSSRQLQKYLNIARLYIPGFEDFTDPKTNRLNGYAKLNLSHITVLQEIRSLARIQRLADIEQHFEEGRRQRAEGRRFYSEGDSDPS